MTHAQIDYPQAVDALQAQAKRYDNLKFGMWLYLASEVVIFTIFIATFMVFRVNFPDAVQTARHTLNVNLVGLNTFLLLTSSWAMVRGLLAIQRGDRQGLIRFFVLMIVLGAVFVALQGVEYLELAHHGVTVYTVETADPEVQALYEFGSRFYAVTAFHGFHVIVGVLWGLYIVLKARRGVYTATNYIGIEIFGLYWHFVDVVWIFLFTIIYLI